jgi:hypothetical protein
MNDSREHDPGMDAGTAERLLRGEAVESSDAAIADLAKVLAVAAEPLPGRPEDARAALTLFRLEHTNRYGRGSRRTTRKARSALVTAGAAAAVFALGGVVIAAQTGAFPSPFDPGPATPGPVPSVSTAVTAGGTRSHGTPRPTPTTSTSTSPTARPPAGSPEPHKGTGHTPAPPEQSASHSASANGRGTSGDLKGLCEAYAKSSQQGKALDAPAQERLDQAAGGRDQVDAYCTHLTGTPVSHGSLPATHPAPHTTRSS